MQGISQVKLGIIGCGLANQLNFLINNIIYSFLNRENVLIVSNFNQQYNDMKYCPVSDIIDLPKFNEYLKSLNVCLIDLSTAKISIDNVQYGSLDKTVDITEDIRKIFNGTSLMLSQGLNFNSFKGDPLPGVAKTLYITIDVCGHKILQLLPEHIEVPTEISIRAIKQRNSLNNMNIVNKWNLNMYLDILRNLPFTTKMFSLVDIIPESLVTSSVNCIHVRNERDALNFWSHINKIPVNEFETILNTKYIDTIRKYFTPEDLIIVLTGNNSVDTNPVLKYLSENGYSYVLTKKNENREINAIMDMITAERYVKVGKFIGSFNPKNFTGSTYSYMVGTRLSSSISKIYIDMDNIHSPEIV